MQYKISFLKRFILPHFILLGVFLGFLLNFSGSCRKDDPVPDFPGNPVVDVSKIHDGAKALETALLSTDLQTIKSVFTDDAAASYESNWGNVSATSWKNLGEALKTRELSVFTDMYAEYSYTKDGQRFTFALACQEDGTWKIMRL